MKKMNGLKIFTLVLLSLSKFETMFGMKKDEIEDIFNDDYVNENYYLIDLLGNKITLNNDEDIKFKICSEEEKIKMVEHKSDNDILEITEENSNKILVGSRFNEKACGPIFYKDRKVITQYIYDRLGIVFFKFNQEDSKKYENKVILCDIVKKIGEDSINNDYILVDAKNNKIEKIKDKNIEFKLLTRKKYLELQKKLNNGPDNFLKNEINQYILNESQNPLFFEEEKDNDLILYVKRLDKDNLCLASLDLGDFEKTNTFITNTFIKDNYIKVHMAKAKDILEEVDSSKCCCGIC